jgi:hypothetical protein
MMRQTREDIIDEAWGSLGCPNITAVLGVDDANLQP